MQPFRLAPGVTSGLHWCISEEIPDEVLIRQVCLTQDGAVANRDGVDSKGVASLPRMDTGIYTRVYMSKSSGLR